MKLMSLPGSRLRLHAVLMAGRHGAWSVLAATLAFTACIVLVAAAVERRDRLAGLKDELAAAQSRLAARMRAPVVARPVASSPGEALVAVLPDTDAGTAQAQSVMSLARQMGLRVRQATYIAAQPDGRSVVQSLQLDLPMRGSYAAARRWADEVLRTLPNVSIDQLDMERSDASEGELTIKVRLSIWHRAAAPLPGRDSLQRRLQGSPLS